MYCKPKLLATILISLFYLVQVSCSFSGNIIDWIQETRYQNQISKAQSFTTKTIELKEWQKLNNKKEIKINNRFFDIHSYFIHSNKITLKLTEDTLESELIFGLQNLFFTVSHPVKKHSKPLKSLPYFASIPLVKNGKTIFLSQFNKLKINTKLLIGNAQNVISIIDRPPIYFII